MILKAMTAAAVALSVSSAAYAQAKEKFFPVLVYRTGAYAPNGVPLAERLRRLPQARQRATAASTASRSTYEECETGYATDRGVECYERLKGKGPTGATLVHPLSTGITFALTDKVPADKIPLVTTGYGRADSVDGSVFTWNFPLLGTYWDAADMLVQHVGKKEGGSTSSRARRSPSSTTTRPTARSRSRCSRSAPRCTASSCSSCR